MRRERPDLTPFVALLVALALLASYGCAQKRHAYAVASQTVAASLFAIQDAEEVAYAAGKVTPAQHQRFNQELVVALTLGRSFNAAVRQWQPGQPPPDNLTRLKASLMKLAGELLEGVAPEVQAQIRQLIANAYDAILAVLMAAGRT